MNHQSRFGKATGLTGNNCTVEMTIFMEREGKVEKLQDWEHLLTPM